MPHSTRRNIYLADEMWAEIQRNAYERGEALGERWTASQVIRQAIREFLAKEEN